ncbi:MAG TPA: NAD-dependent epimerase/dehydratase family protein [Symbiobacteriaceae bacterium]|nr:NAD-dependent epimerase/dehydratase family protein [Symbiobacteriaceae bacterium]
MTILVTGAAGFIGRHVVQRLRAEGEAVLGVDQRPGADRQLDLLTADLDPLLAGVDGVIHLAGQPGVRESWQRFPDYARGNIELTQRLLEALRERPLQKFVLASTSSIYGAAPMPAREEGPLLPVSPYGATKLAAEGLCDLYGRTASIPWVALRFFTVYGPGQRPDMAFTRWLTAQRDGQPVQLFGDGGQVRDFTYVDDVVEAVLRALSGKAEGCAINVGGGSPVSIREALALIEAVTGRPVLIDQQPVAPGDMRITAANTERLTDLLGYVPKTSLADGLARQWEWIQT